MAWKPNERPVGIIRTLPSLYGDWSEGARKYNQSLIMLEKEQIPAIYIALSNKPTKEVLYIYLLINGFIDVRLNIAGFEPGEGSDIKCWDGEYRQPAWWVICSGPVVYPPEPIKRRGFQGFRYTGDLW